jgi:hypothetical protein
MDDSPEVIVHTRGSAWLPRGADCAMSSQPLPHGHASHGPEKSSEKADVTRHSVKWIECFNGSRPLQGWGKAAWGRSAGVEQHREAKRGTRPWSAEADTYTR